MTAILKMTLKLTAAILQARKELTKQLHLLIIMITTFSKLEGKKFKKRLLKSQLEDGANKKRTDFIKLLISTKITGKWQKSLQALEVPIK